MLFKVSHADVDRFVDTEATKQPPPTPTANHIGTVLPKKSAMSVLADNPSATFKTTQRPASRCFHHCVNGEGGGWYTRYGRLLDSANVDDDDSWTDPVAAPLVLSIVLDWTPHLPTTRLVSRFRSRPLPLPLCCYLHLHY